MSLLLFVPIDSVEGVHCSIAWGDIPEYILEDHYNLTGSTQMERRMFRDLIQQGFAGGSWHNLTLTADAVVLEPSLDIVMLNNGNAVFTGASGQWDTTFLRHDVIKHNGTYWLYYSGCRSTSLSADRDIGLATSTDGIAFTRYSSNPVVSTGAWYDTVNAVAPVVKVDKNGTFHMYYGANHGYQSNNVQDIDIAYAYSSDGKSFTKYSGNPVLINGRDNSMGGAWNGIELRPQSLFVEDGAISMYYRATGRPDNPQLALATSKDWKSWNNNANNPIYDPGNNNWEAGWANYGTMEEANGTYRIWTTGGNPWKIGWIWSDDGLDWEASDSAVLSPKAGTIYSSNIRWPAVIDEGDHYRMYAFCQDDTGTNRIGAFNVTPEKLNGTYYSRVYDAGERALVTDISWNHTVSGAGALDMYLRWSNDSRSWSEWVKMNKTWKPVGMTAQYFQYRGEFRAVKDWMGVELEDFHMGLAYYVKSVTASVDGGPWQLVNMVNGSYDDWYINLSLHDGDYNLSVRAADKFGTGTSTRFVKVDLYPPTGDILIEDGRFAHNSTWVKIDVEANDTHHPIQMQLSRRPDFAGATWTDHIPSATYSLLGDPEGFVTVHLRLRDAAGRISETYNDTILIDTTPPEGTLLINEGARYTNSTSVTLRWNATDITGVVGMMASNDPDFQGAIWEDPMKAFGWALEEGDGVRTVYVKLRDFVGWEAVLVDDIILDGTPPAASFVIDQDATFTTTRDVTLNISIHDDNPVRYKIANADEAWPDPWRTTATPLDLPWSLVTGPDGTRTVMMLVLDAADNGFLITDDIVLDTTPPEGELLINDGAAFTNMLLATATLNASDATSGLDRMRISGSDDFTGVSWQTVKTSFPWPLPAGDGTKTLFVQLRDGAGLVSTIDASTILDTAPPSGTISIRGVDEYATDPRVDLVIRMQDAFGLDVMRVSHDAAFPDAVWVPYGNQYPWDLGDQEGEVSVFVMVRDLAGNTFTASVSTVLDLTDPVASALIEHGAVSTLEQVNDLVWSASDAIGLKGVRFHLMEVHAGMEWTGLHGVTSVKDEIQTFQYGGADEPVLVTIIVEVEDLAGRTGTASDDIWYVPERPGGTLVLGDGSGWTNTTSIDVGAVATQGFGVSHFRVALSEVGLPDAEWVPIEGTTTVTLSGLGGAKTVFAQLLGDHEVSSLSFSGEIALDLLAPVVDIVAPTRDVTEEDSARLNVSVVDDQDPVPVVQWRINGGEWQPYLGDERLSLNEGDNLIEVMAQDAAGNVGTSEWTITSERGFSVGGVSWLILLVVVAVVAVVAFYHWRTMREEGRD